MSHGPLFINTLRIKETPEKLLVEIVDKSGAAVAEEVEKPRAEYIVRAVNSHEALLEQTKRLRMILGAIEHRQITAMPETIKQYKDEADKAIAQAEKGA